MSWIKDCKNQLVNLDDVRKICIDELDEESEAFKDGSTHMVSAYSMSTADDDEPDYVFWIGDEDSAYRHFARIFEKLPKLVV